MSRAFTPGDREDFRDETPSRRSPVRQDTRGPVEHPTPNRDPEINRSLETASDPRSGEVRIQQPRTVFYNRDRAYRLRESELHTLTELGKFRLIPTDDLAKHAYEGHSEVMDQDIRNLTQQGLIRRAVFEGPEATPREALTLTNTGSRFVRANRLVPDRQTIYHGFVKPKEANHDAHIYRLYQKEAARIEAEGGRNPRVILDFELKKNINRDFAKLGADSRQEIASRHGLKVVNGKIPIPDLRIEYETREGGMARLDLELATEHYRPRQLAAKARAGFSLYAPGSEADRLRRVLDGQELTAGILSL